MTDTAAIKTQLEEQLVELRGRQARVETDLAEPLNAVNGGRIPGQHGGVKAGH